MITNGPGELSTWVPPVLSRLRARLPQARIELFLLTDQFSSGTEALKAREYPVDALSNRAAFLARLARRKAAQRGIVLMLGGAPRDAVLLARATGYPAYAYSFHGRNWHPGLQGFFVDAERSRREALERGADPARVRVVGNLVVDALAEAPDLGARADVLLLPGSRPFAARYLLGFMLRAAELLAERRPDLTFAWLKSRLLPDAVVQEALSGRYTRAVGGVGARLEDGALVTEGGLRVRVLDEPQRYGAMRRAQLAWTIPGTNTLELALAGLPALVLLPLHKPELLPLEGLVQWVGALPGVGPWIKRRAVLALEARVPYLALPNQWLNTRVYPELRGVFGPERLAQEADALLEADRAREVRAHLARLERTPGADRLVAAVLEEGSCA